MAYDDGCDNDGYDNDGFLHVASFGARDETDDGSTPADDDEWEDDGEGLDTGRLSDPDEYDECDEDFGEVCDEDCFEDVDMEFEDVDMDGDMDYDL